MFLIPVFARSPCLPPMLQPFLLCCVCHICSELRTVHVWSLPRACISVPVVLMVVSDDCLCFGKNHKDLKLSPFTLGQALSSGSCPAPAFRMSRTEMPHARKDSARCQQDFWSLTNLLILNGSL